MNENLFCLEHKQRMHNQYSNPSKEKRNPGAESSGRRKHD
jgi:hypothetical protein